MRLAALALLVAGCEHAEPHARAASRCAHCGMTVAEGSGFAAGSTASTGTAVAFDSPKCLFRWLRTPEGVGARDPWVTEYFTRTPVPVDEVLYVLGSEIAGPMGPDLIPVGRDRAEHFASSHGGRVLSSAELTNDVVDGLFGR